MYRKEWKPYLFGYVKSGITHYIIANEKDTLF